MALRGGPGRRVKAWSLAWEGVQACGGGLVGAWESAEVGRRERGPVDQSGAKEALEALAHAPCLGAPLARAPEVPEVVAQWEG